LEFKVDNLPRFTGQPGSDTIEIGSSIIFSVQAVGTAPMDFQWYFNNTEIAAATGSAYAIHDAQTSRNGDYYCKVTNLCGSSSSDTAILLVLPEVSVDEIPHPGKQVSIYPNPANNTLYIDHIANQSNRIRISDISGNLLRIFTDTSVLDLTDLDSGMYIVTIEYPDIAVISRKRIIVLK
jgi:hypothetical protein